MDSSNERRKIEGDLAKTQEADAKETMLSRGFVESGESSLKSFSKKLKLSKAEPACKVSLSSE